jgi:hypothetical protein
MQPDRPPLDRIKPQARSRGRQMPDGIDGRSVIARRFRDILKGLSIEFDVTSEPDQVLIKRAATLSVLSERLQTPNGEWRAHRHQDRHQSQRAVAPNSCRPAPAHGPARTRALDHGYQAGIIPTRQFPPSCPSRPPCHSKRGTKQRCGVTRKSQRRSRTRFRFISQSRPRRSLIKFAES